MTRPPRGKDRASRSDRPQPPVDWKVVTSSQEAWLRFCTFTGFRVIGLAVERVREHGGSVPEAFDLAVEQVAAEMERDGPPAGLVEAFRRDYRADRDNQIAAIAMEAGILIGAESRRRRRKPAAPQPA